MGSNSKTFKTDALNLKAGAGVASYTTSATKSLQKSVVNSANIILEGRSVLR